MFDLFEAVYFENGSFDMPKKEKSKKGSKMGLSEEAVLPSHHPSLLKAATKGEI